MEKLKKHWNRAYEGKNIQKLGWFESHPGKSLELISKCGLAANDAIVDVGSGASTLIDTLLNMGYRNITALDISDRALLAARLRLGGQAKHINWLVDDLTNPQHLSKMESIALWHDRAVLHFLLEDAHRQIYRETLCNVLKPGGHAIIAAFAIGGATRCSGLDIYNYDSKSLAGFLGADFELREHFNHTYHMPSGDERLYIYTHFIKK